MQSTLVKSRTSRGSNDSLTNGRPTASKNNSEMDTQPLNGASTPEALDEGPNGGKPSNRLSKMKKVAEEHRRKVRETRNRLQEEGRALAQQRKQEELKIQIRTVLDDVMEDSKKDLLLVLQERIDREKHLLRRDLKVDLENSEEILTVEMEKRFANGESFDSKLSRIEKEFEENFHRIAKTEMTRVHKEIANEILRKMEHDTQLWQNKFTRATDERIRRTEENVLTNFRSGVDDAQRHSDAVFNSLQDSVNNLETRFKQRIEVMLSTNATRLSETQDYLKKLIDDGLNERDSNTASSFQAQNDRLRQEMSVMRNRVNGSTVRSKCCTIS